MTINLATTTDIYTLTLAGWQVALILVAGYLAFVGLRSWRSRKTVRA